MIKAPVNLQDVDGSPANPVGEKLPTGVRTVTFSQKESRESFVKNDNNISFSSYKGKKREREIKKSSFSIPEGIELSYVIDPRSGVGFQSDHR